MSEALIKKPDEKTQQDIITLIKEGSIETAEDINYHFPSISIEDAVALLNDEEFYTRICNHTTARVKLLYHTKGIQALDNALTHGDHKDALAAYDRLEKQVAPKTKEKRPMNFAFFTLEEVIDSSSKEKVVKGKVIKPVEEEFKPGLKHRNFIPRSDVNGNIFENGGDEEETETVYIDEGEYDGEEEWEE